MNKPYFLVKPEDLERVKEVLKGENVIYQECWIDRIGHLIQVYTENPLQHRILMVRLHNQGIETFVIEVIF